METLNLASRATVLVIDDAPDNLTLASGLLGGTYTVRLANSGEKALSMATSNPPNLILLDIMMPGMDGYEVCRRLKADPRTSDVPVIFLTAMADLADEEHGFEFGAVDYITKPISPSILLARVKTHIALKALSDALRLKNEYLEQEIEERTQEIVAIQDVTILAMASLAETRDSDTGNHIRRTQYYVQALAKALQSHPRFSHFLTDQNIKTLFKSAPLHDIGKVGIPDRILLKPGRFEPFEFEIMKTHTTVGHDAIASAERSLGINVAFLSMAKEIALSHQEKWDGSGYPEGLAGDAIPISARLMALADVYDALISRRVYKDKMSHEQASEIIFASKGSHFDPDVVDSFALIHEDFRAIALRFSDSDKDIQRKADYLVEAGLSTTAISSPSVSTKICRLRP